jgi:energy-coupling factor transporter ATP-binding protein EcfA2
MRLRYLHLPRCGPLTDTAVVFGREELIARTLNLPRKGSLNFVVGVNGSGKSSLLRTLYRIFRSLNLREWPALPVTLAWDRSEGTETVTTVLHSTNEKDAVPFFATLKQVPTSARRSDWETITAALGKGAPHPFVEGLEIATGSDAITNPLLFARLPKRLIAYTSGADDPWVQLDHPVFHPRDEEESQYQTEDERPPGWSMNQEWEEEQPLRISNVLTRYALKASRTAQTLPGAGQVGEMTSETVERLRQELGPLEAIRQKVFTNRMPRTERLDDSYFRIQSRHLRFAGITLALWQTAREMADRTEEHRREALRNLLLQQRGSDDKPKDARRVLNEIDWFWPTHLSLTYRDADDLVSPRQHQELLCLVALADEVIAQPLGRQRAVFSLGPSDHISLTEKLKDAFPLGIPSETIEFIAERVDGCKTMAEAILRVLSADEDIDSTPMDVFARLREWERTGLLEDLTLTVKRIHRAEAPDGELDDTLLTYDQLSDGEQMLLGRMGLLFLLRGQDGSLLLLDEPETHFNDVWKREIVEMVDMGLLNSTAANVIVATHTSIALTDAFAAEVTVLDKTDGHTTARGVTGGLFGTDPGEVNMNLFRADSSIGRRSVEILDQLLKTEWKGREGELEAILNVLGSSFHRAELRAILKQLRAPTDGTASS